MPTVYCTEQLFLLLCSQNKSYEKVSKMLIRFKAEKRWEVFCWGAQIFFFSVGEFQYDSLCMTKKKIFFFDGIKQYDIDPSPAITTSNDFIRSNEIIRTKWPIY